MKKTLGQYLKNLRKLNNYRQEFVASQIGVSRQAYSHYETGRVIPPNDVCYKIAHFYSISPELIIQCSLLDSEPDFCDLSNSNSSTDLTLFLDYISDETNAKKLQHLTKSEKELLFYYNKLTQKDQNEIIEIMKIKLR